MPSGSKFILLLPILLAAAACGPRAMAPRPAGPGWVAYQQGSADRMATVTQQTQTQGNTQVTVTTTTSAWSSTTLEGTPSVSRERPLLAGVGTVAEADFGGGK